ncbi:RraA family protein [bacterium]|nr:RraA family protein [Verrucomicrobiales bacterium]MDC0311887.1 RraA family protein [bacterium]
MNDSDPIAVIETLYSAVVADVLDSMGHRNQILSADIHALTPSEKVCGRIFTAKCQTISETPDEPYKLEMEAIDTMKKGDVFVVDAGYDRTCGLWGELLTTACIAKGVRGIVMSACSRDLWALNQLDFPVFGIGKHPGDSMGRADISVIGQPIEIDGVAAKNGDFILGDLDGVVIIPQECADEALRLAAEKVAGENVVRNELAAGASVSAVFKKHGIL